MLPDVREVDQQQDERGYHIGSHTALDDFALVEFINQLAGIKCSEQ